MLRSPSLVVVLLLSVSSIGAVGAEDAVDCRSGGRTQLEMNVCAGRDAEAAADKLRALLKELEPKLDPQARGELRQIQERWERLRDEDCHWEQAMFAGGSVAPMIFASCVTARTKERTQRLAIFLCEGAGMTGPCEESRKY